jgi:enoyl-CoA hydratase/carnithine racemase
MSEMLVRAKLAAIVLAVAGSLTLLSAGSISASAARATISAWPGRLPASITASGKVRASLSKKSFTAAEARTVKLVYSFAPASKRFFLSAIEAGGKRLAEAASRRPQGTLRRLSQQDSEIDLRLEARGRRQLPHRSERRWK